MGAFLLASYQLPVVGTVWPILLMNHLALPRFLALAAAILLVVTATTMLLMGLIFWVLGIELPLLSDVFHLLSGKRHEAPSIFDVFGAREVKAIIAGWVMLWVLALGLGYASGGLPGLGSVAAGQSDPLLRMIALTMFILTLLAIVIALLLIFILWMNGVEVPLLSDLLRLVSRKERRGPRLQDLIAANKPLVSIMSGWVIIWLLLGGTLWLYPTGATTPASAPVAQRPASETEEAAEPEEAPPAPQPTKAPAVNVNAPSDVAEIFTAQGCAGCHTLQGIPGASGAIGPELTRIGSVAAERIADPNYTGSATTVEEYIRESILDPKTYVVDGFPPVMPDTFKDSLSAEQLDALVEFLASLK